MTTTAPGFLVSVAAGGITKRIRTALFGVYARYMTVLYLQHTTITLIGLLTIALTIDLSDWLSRLIADPNAGSGLHTILFLGRYLLLRAADILGRLLPFACFLGVLWCEMAAILSRQRVTIWVTGRSTLQCLVPVLALGGIAGVSQFILEAYLRPMAVQTQIEEHLGELGERFDRSGKPNSGWLFAGNELIRARIVHDSMPSLQNFLLIRSDEQGRVTDIVTADRATLRKDGLWDLEAGARLPVDAALLQDEKNLQKKQASPMLTSLSLDQIRLNVDPLWLDYLGINAKYLPQSVLEILATKPDPNYPANEYRTWRAVRIANAFAPFAMALTAATFSLILLPNAIRLSGVFIIGLVGYSSLVSMRSLYSLGERGVVPPFLAAWTTVLVLVSVSVLAIVLQQRKLSQSIQERRPNQSSRHLRHAMHRTHKSNTPV